MVTKNSPHAVTCLKCGHRLTPVNGDVNQQSRVQRRRQQSRRTTFSSRFRPQTLLGVLIAGLLLLGGGYIVGQLLWSSTTSATAESAGKSQVHKPAASDSDALMKATQTFPTTTVTDLVAQATNGLAGQTSVAVMPLTGSQTVV